MGHSKCIILAYFGRLSSNKFSLSECWLIIIIGDNRKLLIK